MYENRDKPTRSLTPSAQPSVPTTYRGTAHFVDRREHSQSVSGKGLGGGPLQLTGKETDLNKEITDYNKGKRSTEQIRDSEKGIYKDLRKHGQFGPVAGIKNSYGGGTGSIATPGVGADFVASDDSRLWMVEGKGNTDWTSPSNLSTSGAHAPFKQIKHTIQSKARAVIAALEGGSFVERMSSDALVVAVTNISEEDAIQVVVVKTTADESKSIVDQYPGALSQVLQFLKTKNEDELDAAFKKYQGDDAEEVYNLKTLAGKYKDIADEQEYSEEDDRRNYDKVLSALTQAEDVVFNPANTQSNVKEDADETKDLNLLEALYNQERQDTADGGNPALESYEEDDGDEIRLYLIPVWRQVPRFPRSD